MIKGATSKLYRLSAKSNLIEKMNIQFNSSQIARKMESDSLFNYLSENDIQIYWPYSQNWDGATTPVITYLSDNNANWSYGYKKIKDKDGSFEIDTLIVNAEYLKNNTVWIINKNNTPYDELPNFEQGEVVNKEGVFFYSEVGKKQMKEKQSKGIGELAGSSVYIGSLCFFGGDAIGGALAVEFVWGHTSGGIFGTPLSGVTNRTRISLLKAEVGKDKQINYNIQPQWFVQQGTNALVVLEKDGGSAKSLIRTIFFKGDSYGEQEAMVDVRIDYERNDDWLFDEILNRNSIFGPDNKTAEGEWKRYQDKDMWFTLPTK